ncbi:MAG TPA: HEAT repeat domain-containing protein [Planctomycetota bacterium]|nr:HEAT repeat domain-containing protein [Planctomycetota bacterium]
MNPRATALLLVLPFAACGDAGQASAPAGPPLPPLQLRPMLAELKTLAAQLAAPSAPTQHELRQLGDVALQLVEADPRTAARVERSLREHTDAWWVLEPAFAHERVEVRRRAAWLAGESAQGSLQVALVLRLKYENDPETVVWVANALARLGNDLGLAWLDAAIGSETTAQAAAAPAIDALRARQVMLPAQPSWVDIRQALQAQTAAWRERGVSALAVTPPATALLDPRFAAHLITTEGTLLRPIDEARFVLTRCGSLPVPLLVRTLAASEPYLRTMTLQVLAEIGPAAKSATPAVLPLLADPLTNSYAVRALGEIGAFDALPHLRPLLAHADFELRAATAQALGLLRDAGSADALRARLGDAGEAPDVRVGAAFALLCLGADAGAEAFLAEREAQKDYHEPTLALLRERLLVLRR